jgi:hypothetical protein
VRLAAPFGDSPGTSHRNLPVIDSDDAAVQAACAAIAYELLRAGSWEDRHRRSAHVPAMLAELKLTPTWRRVLVAALQWSAMGARVHQRFTGPVDTKPSDFPRFLEVSYPRTGLGGRVGSAALSWHVP